MTTTGLLLPVSESSFVYIIFSVLLVKVIINSFWRTQIHVGLLLTACCHFEFQIFETLTSDRRFASLWVTSTIFNFKILYFYRPTGCTSLRNFITIGQTIAEIWRFNHFQNDGRPPSAFLKFRFLTVWRLRDPFCIIMPNCVKIGQTVAEISRFLWFSRCQRPPSWIFKKLKF